ncbi:putative tail protein [Aeromonas phage PVN05]|nr:putative tail protein [Aeromonas phage PVN05]
MKGYSFGELVKLAEAAVPATRKVNGKPLTADITLNAADVKAAPNGFGLGEAIPGALGGSLDKYRHNGWRTYNAEAGDTGAPDAYGTCLDFGHIENAASFQGWAGQLFLANTGEMFGRVNANPGSFNGSEWFKFFTTATPPTAADTNAVPITRKINGKSLNKDVTLLAADVGAFAVGSIENGVHDLNNLVGPAYFGQYEVMGGGTPNWPWNNVDGGSLRIEGINVYTKQIATRVLTGETMERVCDHSGNWTKWELVYTSRSFAKWDDYASKCPETMQNTVGCLSWNQFGNSHVIFDASAGRDPRGAAIDAVNPQEPWVSSHPTLMGWNGLRTYGLRVDVARRSESVHAAAGEKGAIDLPGRASIRYRDGDSAWMHQYADAGKGIVWGHGEAGESYMASLSDNGVYEAATRLQARGSQSRTWGGIGVATVHNASAVVSEGNLQGLITGRYHFPGVYDWETGYGTVHSTDGPSHVFFTSNASNPGPALGLWEMTFGGALKSPGFSISKDGDVYGPVWGGWLSSYLSNGFAAKSHSHDYAPSVHSHTAAQGNHDIVTGDHRSVGAYAMLGRFNSGGQISPGQTIPGNQLLYTNAEGVLVGEAPPGTWKALGYSKGDRDYGVWNVTLFIRVA